MSMDSNLSRKHSFEADDGPPPKKFKTPPEAPGQYSDAVRRKLASTTRTGQACDRCKERKMKCDTDPSACQPCRQKGLPCLTTDRVTGRASERGQSERLHGELQNMRRHLDIYARKYGSLKESDFVEKYTDRMGSYPAYAQPYQLPPQGHTVETPRPGTEKILHDGPVNGTVVDLVGTAIDIAAFECDDMEEYDPNESPKFNNSITSVVNTICGAQKVDDPQLPPEAEALKYVQHFLTHIWPYVPLVHRPTFLELTSRYYKAPASVTISERTTIVVVLAIIAHQMAVRNPGQSADMMAKSNLWLHYGLTSYRDLFHDHSLASMQAMTLLVVHFRNLPKPGYNWNFSSRVLVRAIDLNYHRSPDRIFLPKDQDNPLSKELRKRVFWTILGICVTTGSKVGKPMPCNLGHVDVPPPLPIEDREISATSLKTQRSGKCDFWPAMRLFKLLPLLSELYDKVIVVRRSSQEYTRTVEDLHAKIVAWRKEWDQDISVEVNEGIMKVPSLHIEIWAAEYELVLHHPKLDTSNDVDLAERNLHICYGASKRLLESFKTLYSKYRGVDFTWHSIVSYTLAFGVVLCIWERRIAASTQDRYDEMKRELSDWLHVIAIADVIMKTNNFMARTFEPMVRRLESDYRKKLNTTSALDFQPSQPNGVEMQQRHKSESMSQSPQIYPPAPHKDHHLDTKPPQDDTTQPSYRPPYIYPHPPLVLEYNPYPDHRPGPSSGSAGGYPSFSHNGSSTNSRYPSSISTTMPTPQQPLLNENSSTVYLPYQTNTQIPQGQPHHPHGPNGPLMGIESYTDYSIEDSMPSQPWPVVIPGLPMYHLPPHHPQQLPQSMQQQLAPQQQQQQQTTQNDRG